MKILLINVVYKTGSTGNIVANLFSELKNKGNETFLIYGRGKHKKEANIYKETLEFESKIHHFFSLFTGNLYGGMFFSTKRIISRIKKIKPDVVNLHCLNGYFVNIYKIIKWLAKNNIKTVMTMHADFMMTGGCGYSVECKKYENEKCKNCKRFRQINSNFSYNAAKKNYLKMEKSISLYKKAFLKITAVSPWLAKRYASSPIYKKFAVCSILNPVDDIFFTNFGKNPYKNDRNILYVTSDITDKTKSGWLIDDLASLRKDLNFTVISLRNVSYNFKNKNVTYVKGGVPKMTLKNYYHYANATLLLSQRETFSMIVAESLCCGTPVFGFKCGGPETIAIDKYCNFIIFPDIRQLATLLPRDKIFSPDIRQEANRKYGISNILNNYIEVYKF